MIYPDKKTFMKLARKGNLIPIFKEILADFDTPLSSFLKIDKSDYAYLLESVEGGQRLGRYSFLGSNPSLVFQSKGNNIRIREFNKVRKFVTDKDPLYEIENLMKKYKYVELKGHHRFSGGMVGYIGYDMVRYFERLPDKNPDQLNLPDCVFLMTDTMLIFDHVERKIRIVSNAYTGNNPGKAYDEAVRKISVLEKDLRKSIKFYAGSKSLNAASSVESNMTKQAFCNMVNKAKEYIRKGDIIQTVLSQRFSVGIKVDPFEIYRALRTINPSPYMFYMKLGDFKLVGSSPEILVRTENNIVEVRPIAGTRPRGRDDAEDVKLIRSLLKDPKEKAEHIMLVDLGRNDIGRVCEFHTVKTTELMKIEKYSHVIHIVSDVSGKLRRGKNIFDVMRATFPAGTVSGAPKIRAMEIIDELENTKRGPYAGGLGYFSFSGNQDFCIMIRTILIKGNRAFIQAGAGIVKDSIAAKEYKETQNKARALLKSIETAEKGLN